MLVINKYHWFHRWVFKFASITKHQEQKLDICTYTRKVFRAFFSTLFWVFIFSVVALYAGMLSLLLAEGIAAITGMSSLEADPSWLRLVTYLVMGFLGCVFIVIVVLSTVYLFAEMRHKAMNHSSNTDDSPSFAKQAYLSWKHKYCVKIKVK